MGNFISHHDYVLMAAAVPLIWAAVSDGRTFRIPNGCSLALLALYPFHVWLSPVSIDLFMSGIVAVSVFAAGIALYATGRFGAGDVKLMGAAALWAGPSHVWDFLTVTALAGGVLGLIVITRLKIVLAFACESLGAVRLRDALCADRLPYGVAIAAGGGAVLFQLAG